MRPALGHARFRLLATAALCLGASLVLPPVSLERPVYDLLFLVDITGSMMVRDVAVDGAPASRLDATRTALRRAIAALPCRSRVGLAIFTERQPVLLISPTELCDGYAPLDAAIAGLDRRMAWEGDSRIFSGLARALPMAGGLEADLVFLTDGHEAPPARADRPPVYDGRPGAVGGMLVGVGGYELAPIPRYDDEGREIGFYAMGEVEQENREGAPPEGMAEREGFNPRNAPYGGAMAEGTEHMSSVKEGYLRELARLTGLAYAHLDDPSALAGLIEAHATRHPQPTAVGIGAFPAAMALLLLAIVYLGLPLAERWRRAAGPDPAIARIS